MDLYNMDLKRYAGHISMNQKMFLYGFRKYNDSFGGGKRILGKLMMLPFRIINGIEIAADTVIGGGLYLGHPYGITINPKAVIGKNCNIHKGVTIGQENRGKRKGVPVIGDCVWIGVNATIVGHIKIGDDVLIAPNSYVNQDVPSHSVVFGNPCTIKHVDYATEGYINNI